MFIQPDHAAAPVFAAKFGQAQASDSRLTFSAQLPYPDVQTQRGDGAVVASLTLAGRIDLAGHARLQAAIDRLRGSRWHIQLFTRPSVIAGIADLVEAAPMPIVFDHFGGAQAAAGMNQPGFDALLRVVKSGRAYVKISGAYRVSTQAPDYPDVRPMAEALGWPDKPISWDDIAELSANPDGWASKGHPEWGQFKFGHTHPDYSNVGLLSLTALAYSAVDKTSGLTTDNKRTGYGYGWLTDTYRGAPRLYHTGSTIGFRNAIIRIPTLRATVIILTNRNEGEPEQTATRLAGQTDRSSSALR